MRAVLAEVGLALAGRAGARLADVFGAQASRDTILRLVDALPEPQSQSPRVVGIDEYAMRKGRVYGTVLVDVDTRRPVDLLPDREVGTVAAWLTEHPGIEVVCSDRAPFFAEGASIGAPTAAQSPTGSISGATSAKQPSGASPATARASVRPSPGRRRRRLRYWNRPRAGRHGPPGSGSPTAPVQIKAVRADDLPSLHTFVNGLERDLAAVTAGLTLPWSSGIVEGHVNRIKMIKRQMYGRAGLGLLRKRVLLAS